MAERSSKLPVARALAWIVVASAASLVYINTLVAAFTFDDNFAVISNGDVTDDAMPLVDIFRHDFWGQAIRSDMSHKSYRPVTVLSFRCIRQAWMAAVRAFPGLQQMVPAVSSQGSELEQPALPNGLHPLPYHAANVLLHAVASVLVLILAQQLFTCLEQLKSTAATTQALELSKHPAAAPAAATAATRTKPATQAVLSSVDQQGLRLRRVLQAGATGTSTRTDDRPAGSGGTEAMEAERQQDSTGQMRTLLRACIAALLFALHPVHTEAVSGIVGHAELLCACLSIPALLLYMSAISFQQQHHLETAGKQGRALRHWILFAAAVLLAWAAALSKEIGITVIGTMALYDMLLGQQQLQLQQQHAAHSKDSTKRLGSAAGRLQLVRLVLLGCAGVAYIKLRSWLAGDHLVRIYRKVENPIPFAACVATRIMSTGYLHAKYAHLLLYPMHLSADWSYACIPLLESWRDPRNVMTALLYSYLLFTCVRARPLALIKELMQAWTTGTGSTSSSSDSSRKGRGSSGTDPSTNGSGSDKEAGCAAATAVARWRLLVLAGLLVGPFFPAANVLFYVGTFIGERLLYFPSIGFCLLLAEGVANLLFVSNVGDRKSRQAVLQKQGQQRQQDGQQQEHNDRSMDADHVPRQLHGAVPLLRQCATALLLVSLLCFYAWRTVERNRDWLSEEALFTSALQVCPDSAKVRLNAGILARRQQDFDLALEHFRHAQRVEPGYCEPTYWMGVTRINKGAAKEGMALLVDALSCKYVAADALKALNKIYGMLLEASPNDQAVLLEWGKLLASPQVGRAGDACTVLEDAALQAAQMRRPPATIDTILQPCLAALETHTAARQIGPSSDSPLSYDPVLAMMPAQALADCVRARRRVYKAMARHGSAAKQVQSRAYAYIHSLEQAPLCRRTASEGQGGSGGGVASTQQRLINRIQSTDAEDPWLQLEWARSLLVPGLERAHEASIHLQVASALFGQVIQAQQPGTPNRQTAPGTSSKARSLLQPDKALGPEEAAAGAIQALELLASLPGLKSVQHCSALQNACQLRSWLAGRLQQQLAAMISEGGVVDQVSMEQAAAEQQRATSCAQALQANVHCTAVLQAAAG